jgi:hypothetical protein
MPFHFMTCCVQIPLSPLEKGESGQREVISVRYYPNVVCLD